MRIFFTCNTRDMKRHLAVVCIIGIFTLSYFGFCFFIDRKYSFNDKDANQIEFLETKSTDRIFSKAGLSYDWFTYIYYEGSASCSITFTFENPGSYFLNVCVPLSATRINFYPHPLINYTWISDAKTYRTLMMQATFTLPKNYAFLGFHWNACAPFFENRFYFGGNEGQIPAPTTVFHNRSYPCLGLIEVGVSARQLSDFQFDVEPTSIELRRYSYDLIYEDPRYLPSFSFVPFHPPTIAETQTITSGNCEIICPSPLVPFARNMSTYVKAAYSELHERLGLFPFGQLVRIIVQPTPVFNMIINTTARAYYQPTTRNIVIQSSDLMGAAQGFEDSLQTVIHEMVHAFMHDLISTGLPDLFIEGLAEYFSWQIMRDWEFEESYQQQALYASLALSKFLEDHGSLTLLWQWNLELSHIDYGYAVAWWIIDYLANATPPETFKRFFLLSLSGGSRIGTIGRLAPVTGGWCWGIFAAYYSIAAGFPTEGILVSVGCPLIPYFVLFCAGFILILLNLTLSLNVQRRPFSVKLEPITSYTWQRIFKAIFLMALVTLPFPLIWIGLLILVLYLFGKFSLWVKDRGWPSLLSRLRITAWLRTLRNMRGNNLPHGERHSEGEN